jgi:hypothetical protein
MSTGESAFSHYNIYKKCDSFSQKAILCQSAKFHPENQQRITSSTGFNKNRKSNNTKLVNTKSIDGTKAPPVNFLYLVNAYKLMYKHLELSETPKPECENQSSDSADDTSSSNPNKRFEKNSPTVDCNFSSPIVPVTGCPSYSELISDESSYFSRPKRFGDRPDVIYKTILRSFKKYYLTEFNEVTDYKRKKRRSANHGYLIEMSQNFVSSKMGDTPFEDLELFVAALVQPKLPTSLENNVRLLELSKVV